LAYTSPFDLKPAGGHFGEGEGESLPFFLAVVFFLTTTFFVATGFLTTGFLVGAADLVAEALGVGDLVAL
jgi:hypothetical protein